MPEPDDANVDDQLVDAEPDGDEPTPEDVDATSDDDQDAEPEPPAKPELSEEDKQFLEMKKYGMRPDQMVRYMKKGYDAEHGGAADENPKPDAAAGDDDEFLPVTKQEMQASFTEFGKQAVNTIHAAQADATIEGLLDASHYADDDTSRAMVKAKSWRLMRNGTKPREAFKIAAKNHAGWIAKQIAATNKKKIAAKATGGSVSHGTPATPVEPPDLEHKEDDFQTGKAQEQGVDFMRNAAKA